MLLRRHLGGRLAAYYAQPSNLVVGSLHFENKNLLADGISFSSLWGEAHWRRVYGRLYEEQQGQWLTPVELFRPYYSQVLANFVSCQNSDDDTESSHPRYAVVELGGGRGTNAQLLLSYLQETRPDCYNRLESYTIIDSSPSLLELQHELLLKNGPHADKIRLERKDLLDVAEEREPLLESSNIPTVVIALEVLDNLPHDKVRKDPRTRLLQQAELVDTKTSGGDFDNREEEVFVPLSDSLLTRILKRVPAYCGSMGRPFWVPSVACGVVEQLNKVRPNARLLLADFDYLPPPDLIRNDDSSVGSSSLKKGTSEAGEGEPLVTSMDGVDHECYLNAPNDYCDILFPTDFDKLAKFVEKTWKKPNGTTVSTSKQSAFLQQQGPAQVRATQSWLTGYTPLVHDFANCTVLTVTKGGEII